jgi:hypothetical protein
MDTNKKQNADKAVFDGSVLAISIIKTQFASSLGKDACKITCKRGDWPSIPPKRNYLRPSAVWFLFVSIRGSDSRPFAVVLTGLVPGNYRSDG